MDDGLPLDEVLDDLVVFVMVGVVLLDDGRDGRVPILIMEVDM